MNTLSPETSFQTQQFLDAFHYAQRGMGARIELGRFRFLHHDPKWREAIKITHAFADKYVAKALTYRQEYIARKERNGTEGALIVDEDTNKRYVLLQEIAKETDDRVELRSQIIHVFLAGHDSTAITIGNAIFHFSRYQEKWKKLRAEVLAIGDAPLTFERLKELQYLQHVVKESKPSTSNLMRIQNSLHSVITLP